MLRSFYPSFRILMWMWRGVGWQQSKRAASHLRKSRAAYREGNFRASLGELREACRLMPENFSLLLQFAGWSRFGLVPSDEAIDIYSRIIEHGSQQLALHAIEKKFNLLWERKGAAATVLRMSSELERLLHFKPLRAPRIAALLNEAQEREEAMAILAQAPKNLRDRIGYLKLTLAAADKGIVSARNGKLAQRIAQRLELHEKAFDQMVQDGTSAAVVANGPSLMNQNLGRKIDSHNTVIRFNNHAAGRSGGDQGVRTDIWFRPASFQHVPLPQGSLPELMVLTGPNLQHRSSEALQLLAPYLERDCKISLVPPSIYYDLFTQLDSSPSAGLIGLAMLAERCGGQVPADQVFGYSLDSNTESTSYYYGHIVKGAWPSRHNWKAEANLFRHLRIEKGLS